MTILDYVRRLSPTYERKEVMGVLRQLREEMRDYTLPIAKDAQEAFVDHTFKSAYTRELTQAMRKRVMFQGSPLDILVISLERLDSNIDVLEKEVKKKFAFQFSTANITYDRVELLRYIESALFYTKYFRKLLLRLVAEEAIALGSAAPLRWAKAERMWLDNNLKAFVELYPAMAKDSRDLTKTLANTATAEIDEATAETAEKTLGHKLDPMRLNAISANHNPFFIVGKMLAELQVKQYQATKEESQALQLRLQELREIQGGGDTSPKLQKLIHHTENRIEQLDYRIHQIEEDNRMD